MREAAGSTEANALREQAERSLQEAERGIANLLTAAERGVVIPGTQERVDELERKRRRAHEDMARADEARLDPALLAEYLSSQPPQLTDRAVLDAFVHRCLVWEESVSVVLRTRDERDEPERLDVSRVRTIDEWCPVCESIRTELAVVDGMLVLRFPRAA